MERRSAPRKVVLMSGAIELAGGAIQCLISNMSISGAALEITNSKDIPERFSLFFKADGRAFLVALHGAKMSGSA